MSVDSGRESILLAELEHTRKIISEYMKSGDQILTVALTAGVAAFAAFNGAPDRSIILFLPAILLAPTAYALRQNGLIQHLGGHRKALEEVINAGRAARLLVWESTTAPTQKRSFHAYVSYSVLVLIWVGCISFAEVRLFSVVQGNWLRAGVTCGYLLATMILTLSFASGLRIFDRAYTTSLAELQVGAQQPAYAAKPAPAITP